MTLAAPLTFRASTLPAGWDPARIFKLMESAFDEASTTGSAQVLERRCVFAGEQAELRIVGHELGKHILPAFAHLLQEERELPARLKIDFWHQSETGVPCPIDRIDIPDPDYPAWKKGEYGFTIGSPADRFMGRRRLQMFMWLDRETQRIIGWAKNGAEFSALERANPVRFPLSVWHSDQGAEVIHAGLVSKNGHGILLGGKGGVGKTTTALACLYAGFEYLGDDYIGLQAADHDAFIGHSLYSSAWLPKDNLVRFPALVAHANRGEYAGRERHLIFLHTLFSGRFASCAAIRTLVLPRITSASAARLRPAKKSEALLRLAPTSMINLPSSGAGVLWNLASLVERVPCYWLELGSDLESVPRCLEEAIF
jgi:hypothetical protein